jgi:hypothetical protein
MADHDTDSHDATPAGEPAPGAVRAADPAPDHVRAPEAQPTPPGRATTARSALIAVFVAAALAVVFAGDSITKTGEDMPAGFLRDVVTNVGKPAGSIARALPFASAADSVVGWFKKDPPKPAAAVRPGAGAAAGTAGGAATAITPADFDRRTVQTTTPAPKLASLIVTGDSMSMPLDVHLARALTPLGVKVTRDPHIGSGISKVEPVDWTKLAPQQIADHPSDVVVVLLGANEGFPLGKNEADACCGAAWTADYANRVRQMAQSYFDGGAQQILWLALPGPRDPRRQPITRAVNSAVRVALGAFGTRATVLATDDLFTPGGKYRDAMPFDGKNAIVRQEDGIHLNDDGAELAARAVEAQLRGLYALR